MKNLRVLLALAAVSVAASACGSDPVAAPDPDPRLTPRYESTTTADPGTNPCVPTNPSGTGTACQVLGSGG